MSEEAWSDTVDPALLEQARREMEREADCQVEGGKYEVLAHRTWTDEYSDECTISVQCAEHSGEASVVIGAAATWLTAEQVEEVREWLAECREIVSRRNRNRA